MSKEKNNDDPYYSSHMINSLNQPKTSHISPLQSRSPSPPSVVNFSINFSCGDSASSTSLILHQQTQINQLQTQVTQLLAQFSASQEQQRVSIEQQQTRIELQQARIERLESQLKERDTN